MSQFELRETSRLQIFPGLPDDLAPIAKIVPRRLEDVLKEVRPCRGVCHNMLHEEEGSTLQNKQCVTCVLRKLHNVSAQPVQLCVFSVYVKKLRRT